MAYDSQYNNGAPNGYGYQPGPAQTLEIKQREKRQIRKLGNISGLGILLFALFQFIGAGPVSYTHLTLPTSDLV